MQKISCLPLLLLITLTFCEIAACAQDVPSLAIRTDSQRDSLIFRVRLDGQTRFRLYFEDRLQADLPPFEEKHFAIEPQREWSCVGIREVEGAFEVVIFADCKSSFGLGLKKLYQIEEIPII